MVSFLKEFKEFAIKGNMIDIAIGVIIGTAFNKVVEVLVKEVFMPPLSFLTDSIDWASNKWVLREAITEEGFATKGEIAIAYGKLIEVSADFIIIGFTVFFVVKVMNTLKRKAQDPTDVTVKTPKDIELLSRVADLLETQNRILEQNKDG